jgi:hypothetical protein
MGSIPVQLTSCFDLFGLVCFANKTKIVSCHTADSKPVKQEVNCTVILPPLVFPGYIHEHPAAWFNKATAIYANLYILYDLRMYQIS